jgi:hypothetical protein
MNALDTSEDRDYYPETLSDMVVHELEFSIAISNDRKADSGEAPMLEALTTYREEQLN